MICSRLSPLLLLSVTAFLLTNSALAQTWARTVAGLNNNESNDVAVDAQGNVYTTGYFSGNVTFGTTVLSSNGITDIFLVKYSAAGAVLWAVSAGGTGSDRGNAVWVAPNGSVAVTGFYSGAATFGAEQITAQNNSQDLFVASYSSNGELNWVRSAGSNGGSDIGNAVSADSQSNILVGGQFSGEATFEGTTISGAGTANTAFLASYTSAGDLSWVRAGSAPDGARTLGITAGSDGAVYATGQFSGDITFDNLHPNNANNAMFVVKYSSGGAEQWFRMASSSSQIIANDAVTDGNGNICIAGSFLQDAVFLDAPNDVALTPTYNNAAFVASYNASGNLNWSRALSSASMVEGRGLAAGGGNLFLGGIFACRFDDLSNEYGSGVFLSSGFDEVFICALSADNGNLLHAQQFGSRQDDRMRGVGANAAGQVAYAGSFSTDMVVPGGATMGGSAQSINGVLPDVTHCNDANYTSFYLLDAGAGLTGYTIFGLDFNRSPYDFFSRQEGACNTDYLDACIRSSPTFIENQCGSSPISGCGSATLVAQSLTASNVDGIGDIGPLWNYAWQPNASSQRIKLANTSGTYTVDVTSADGCFSSQASVEVEINPLPPVPLLSDDQGVNTSTAFPNMVEVCEPETVVLTAESEFEGSWNTPDGIFPGESYTATQTGIYSYVVTDENGCSRSVNVLVQINPLEPTDPLEPAINVVAPNDSVVECINAAATINVYDSLTFAGDVFALPEDIEVQWEIETPDGFAGGLTSGAYSIGFGGSGWYVITANITRPPLNECGGDTLEYTVTDSLFIDWLPAPEVDLTLLTEILEICGSNNVILEVEGNYQEITFNGQGLINITESSAEVTQPGEVLIAASSTNEFGCSASDEIAVDITATPDPQAVLISETNFICPGQTVTLGSSPGDGYQWIGPTGPVGGNEQTIEVTEAGIYFCEVSTAGGCVLATNTLEVVAYSTPQLVLEGLPVLCTGDTLELVVQATGDIEIEWEAPLSGNDTIQFITEPGTYIAYLTACNITTVDSITVEESTVSVSLENLSQMPLCDGDTALVGLSGVTAEDFANVAWSTGQTDVTTVPVTSSGSVTVQVNDAAGCEAEASIQVNFTPIPGTPAVQPIEVCAGQDAQVSAPDGVLWTWFSDTTQDPLTQGDLAIDNIQNNQSYFVQATVGGCTGPFAALEVDTISLPVLTNISSNSPVCVGQTLEVTGSGNSITSFILQAPDGLQYGGTGNGVSITADETLPPGFYVLIPSRFGCRGAADSVFVDFFIPEAVSLPDSLEMCFQRRVELIPVAENIDFFVWNQADTVPTFLPDSTGLITLEVTDKNGCKSSANSFVEVYACSLPIPNVITPNGDGRNDSWVLYQDGVEDLAIRIYNRWGKQIARVQGNPAVWDGVNQNSNEPATDGTYFYVLSGLYTDGFVFNEQGYLTIQR